MITGIANLNFAVSQIRHFVTLTKQRPKKYKMSCYRREYRAMPL